MLSNTISASSGYTPNIQPQVNYFHKSYANSNFQVAAGQSSPNTNGITNGNGIPNVGQSSPNLYNNMQQTGSQQTNGLYNFPQNGKCHFETKMTSQIFSRSKSGRIRKRWNEHRFTG